MKRILALLISLCMLIMSGCTALMTDARQDGHTVSLEILGVSKNTADFKVTVKKALTPPSVYGWVLYDSLGDPLKSGESAAAQFTVDGLDCGVNYFLSAWAQISGDKKVCEHQVLFETDCRYDGVIAKGIDVSRWQEDIDWQAVSGDGVDFVIIRAGYTGGVDSRFEEYYSGASAAGLDIGVYYYSYADTVSKAEKDASELLELLGSRPLDYPVFYDIEDDCQARLSGQQLTAIALAFCEAVERGGYTAGIYTGEYILNDQLDQSAIGAKYQLWVASVYGAPPDTTNYQMVQYSHTGSVSGIKGEVDLNASYDRYG